MAILTLAAYARLCGVSHAAVQKRIDNGTITERSLIRSKQGKIIQINSKLADNDFSKNADPVQVHAQRAAREMKKEKQAAKVIKKPEEEKTEVEIPVEFVEGLPTETIVEEENKIEKPKSEFADAKAPKNTKKKEVVNNQEVEVEQAYYNHDLDRYKKAKASTEELKARKIEFEVLEMEGKLVDVDDVKRIVAKLITETKDTILNVPAKIGPDLLACSDLVELENKLLKALNDALSNLSRLQNAQFGK